MRHFDELKEGDQIETHFEDGTPAMLLKVTYKEIDVLHLSPYLGDASYKIDRYTKKLYKWTATGWDTVRHIIVGAPTSYGYHGD